MLSQYGEPRMTKQSSLLWHQAEGGWGSSITQRLPKGHRGGEICPVGKAWNSPRHRPFAQEESGPWKECEPTA